jgi:hypothetical protein
VLSVLYSPIALQVQIATIRDDRRKVLYTRSGQRWVEFDLARDPGELHPSPDVDADLRQRLASHVKTAYRALAARQRGAGKNASRRLPKEVADQLRKLGYLK